MYGHTGLSSYSHIEEQFKFLLFLDDGQQWKLMIEVCEVSSILVDLAECFPDILKNKKVCRKQYTSVICLQKCSVERLFRRREKPWKF